MKRILVIGASSGIGRGLAQRYLDAGCSVGVVGRREPLLRELAEAHPQRCRCAVADLMQPEAAVAALDEVVASLGGMEMCIVAAGTGELNPALDFALEEPTLRTNVVGWTAVVDWAYAFFERQGGGHLAVLTSVGGLRGSGVAPAYNASKAYQINYAEGLRQKAARARIPLVVTDIRPGLVATAMARGEGLFWVMPVDRVVGQIVRALGRRRRVAVVTRRWRIAAWLLRRLPTWIYLKM